MKVIANSNMPIFSCASIISCIVWLCGIAFASKKPELIVKRELINANIKFHNTIFFNCSLPFSKSISAIIPETINNAIGKCTNKG